MKPQAVDDKPMHGSPPRAELAKGPMEDRSCTDFLCFVLFVLASVLFYIILAIGFAQGHPERLSYAYDSDGRPCGQEPDVRLAPYIYLVAPYPGYFNRSVCVSQCPSWSETEQSPGKLVCTQNSVVSSCNEFISLNGKDPATNVKSIFDALLSENSVIDLLMNHSVFVYNSTPVLERICLPSGKKYVDAMMGNMESIVQIQLFEQWVGDIKLTYKIIFASAGIAFFLGLVYMLVIRYCGGVLTWLAIFFYFVFLVLFISYLNTKSNFYQARADINTQNKIPDSDNQDLQTAYALKILMVIMIVVAAISVLGLICYFNRIRMAIAIIKTAAMFVMETPTVMLVPPIISIILMGFWALWIVALVYLYSVGEIKGSSDSPLATVEWNEDIRYYLIYHLFYGLWTNATIQAFSNFIIASSCCLWFYTQGTGQIITFHVTESVKRSFLYHIGSLIFGGLLLAIVQFVRFWLEYINYQMKQVGGDKQQPLKCFLDCCRCYAACFERFISFLNKNAFIQIALTGDNFCTAAKNGFHLMWSNAGQYAITNGIGSVFCGVCKLFIAFGSTFICYQIITQSDQYKEKLNSPIVPSILFFIIAYMIGDLFMQVYGMSIDAILQCAITEEQLAVNGQANKHTPEPIREFLQKYKKQ